MVLFFKRPGLQVFAVAPCKQGLSRSDAAGDQLKVTPSWSLLIETGDRLGDLVSTTTASRNLNPCLGPREPVLKVGLQDAVIAGDLVRGNVGAAVDVGVGTLIVRREVA